MKRLVAAFGILLLDIGLLALAAQTATKDSLEARDSFTNQTDVKVFELEVSEHARAVRLRLALAADTGCLRWTLTDAEGIVRGAGDLREGREEYDSGNLLPAAGRWVLRIERENASGTYDLRLQAR